jgi:hypothetical protein
MTDLVHCNVVISELEEIFSVILKYSMFIGSANLNITVFKFSTMCLASCCTYLTFFDLDAAIGIPNV